MDIKDIADFINEYKRKDIRIKSRANRLPLYRQYYFLLAYRYVSSASLEEIGQEVGVNHSNVYTQMNSLVNIFCYDKNSEKEFNDIECKLLERYPEKKETRDFLIAYEDYSKSKLIRKLNKSKEDLNEARKELREIKTKYRAIIRSLNTLNNIVKE